MHGKERLASALLAGMLTLSGCKPADTGTQVPPYVPCVPKNEQAYLSSTPIEMNEIGKGEARVGLNYVERTNLKDPEVKARVDEDIRFINDILSKLPILGSPEIAISAHDRYKYDFPSITPGQLGAYQKERNYFFINMEETDPVIRRYLINHEMGGHYLSTCFNAKNLVGYIDEESARKAKQAEVDLLNQIRRYEHDYDKREAGRPDLILDQKFRDGVPVTLEEIVQAANVYPSHLLHNPQEFIRFKFADKIDMKAVRQSAEEELAGEFAGFLLTAQQLGLFDTSYEHPVLKIFKEVKNNTKGVG